MTRSGPQKYPGASTAYWYQDKYPGDAMESNVIVWHSTEGTSLPSYSGGSEAPNFTAVPDFKTKKLVWYQHFDFDTSSRALVNAAGGIETNTLNVCQVEVTGTCDPATHKKWGSTPHLYMPELPDWAVRDLAAFARWAHDEHGVPLTSGLTFAAYPGSYGATKNRMSGAKWEGFKGHCGHQHVPENDHGDPGAFPMAAILSAATGGSPNITTPPQEDDVPKYVNLGLTKSYTLKPGAWDAIEYTAEYTDQTGDHATDGSVFVRGDAYFTGTIWLSISGLAPGEVMQVRQTEVKNDGGTLVHDHPVSEVIGTDGGTYAAVPIGGHVVAGNGMRVRLLNQGAQPITISGVTLKAFIWKS